MYEFFPFYLEFKAYNSVLILIVTIFYFSGRIFQNSIKIWYTVVSIIFSFMELKLCLILYLHILLKSCKLFQALFLCTTWDNIFIN